MIHISTLFHFDFFKNFKLVAGEKGLHKNISNVVILEYESIENDFSGFHEGDFVLTSLFFAKDNPKLVLSSLQKLTKIGISGIAIKTIYYDQISNELKSLANTMNVPIFLFNSVYMEDIIIAINSYIGDQKYYNYYESKINEIINHTISKSEIINFVNEIDATFQYFISSLYIEHKDFTDSAVLLREYNNITYKASKLLYNENFFCTKYKNGFLFIFHFREIQTSKAICQKFSSLLTDLEIKNELFNIGIADKPHPIAEIDLSIKESLYSAKSCDIESYALQKYSEIGINSLIFPLYESKSAINYLNSMLDVLETYDKKHQGNLINTLYYYLKNNRQIDLTAKALFQHPNTVRYRIQKAKTLTGFEDDFNFSFVIMLLFKLTLETFTPKI